MIGDDMHDLMRVLFPICRSLTGDGNRDTLVNLRQHIPLKMYEVASGTKCFDWVVPDEWNCRSATLVNENSNVLADFSVSNLHVVGYSEPVNSSLSLDELDPHLHSLPSLPYAIPYVTSYYERNWGFCLPHSLRGLLGGGEQFHAYIDSTLEPGYLTYADLVIPGRSEKEVLISTYICHPSLANDNLSGPVVATFLAKWLMEQPRRYTYRFVFVPETIGSIVYLSRHLDHLKRRVIAGFQMTCVGDNNGYSFLSSRLDFSLSDQIAQHVLGSRDVSGGYGYYTYGWTERGSDERQWCAPGIDLPVTSVMRSKYATFPEYHTSLDNLDFVTPEGLEGGYNVLKECIEALECNYRYYVTHLGEPQMGRRGLYSPTNMDFLTYCDGRTLLEIAETLGRPIANMNFIAEEMLKHGLVGREE